MIVSEISLIEKATSVSLIFSETLLIQIKRVKFRRFNLIIT